MTTPMLQHELRQSQTLTPRLQQAVRLLQLSSIEFAHELQQAMASNPFLEPQDLDNEDAEADAAAASPVNAVDDRSSEPDVPGSPEPSWEAEPWASAGAQRNGTDSHDLELADITPAVETLRDYLHAQARLLPTSERDRALMQTLIEAIDDDGYLRIDLEELKGLSGLVPQPDPGELQTALRLVQSLEPSGVGARDLRECLLLQIGEQEAGADGVVGLARRIVADHLDLLARRDLAAIAAALGESADDVERACERIRRLDPRPGWRYGAAATRYIVPDVIARKHGGRWTVSLNPGIVPRIRLNRQYAELFKAHRDASHRDLAAQLQEARWALRNVEQRFATIVRVAEAIVQRQYQFFEYGELAMKPLALKELADELGLHESTISRITNNKYMATPGGVVELKYFLSRSLTTASGGRCSATAIRSAIKDMIQNESAAEPLSDAQIARRLARQGLQVARRTVTKYRQGMRLPAYEVRRRSGDSAAS